MNKEKKQMMRDDRIRTERREDNQAHDIQRQELSNAGSLANTRQQGANSLSTEGLRGRNQLATVGLTGQNRMNQIGARNQGAMDRLNQGQTNDLALGEQRQRFNLETLGKQNDFNKSADVRGLGLDAVRAGQNSPEVENLVNYEGNEVGPSLGGVNFPQAQTSNFRTGKLGKYDKKGKKIGESLYSTNQQTGQLSQVTPGGGLGVGGQQEGQQPGRFTEDDVLVAENTFGKNFNPKQMTDEQLEYSNSLYESNPDLAEYLHQKYTQK